MVQLVAIGRIYYRRPLQIGGSRPRVKLDLTADELLATEPVKMLVSHPYPDARIRLTRPCLGIYDDRLEIWSDGTLRRRL